MDFVFGLSGSLLFELARGRYIYSEDEDSVGQMPPANHVATLLNFDNSITVLSFCHLLKSIKFDK